MFRALSFLFQGLLPPDRRYRRAASTSAPGASTWA